MTCTQCGAEVETGSHTCASCGTDVPPPPPPRWPPRPATTTTPPPVRRVPAPPAPGSPEAATPPPSAATPTADSVAPAAETSEPATPLVGLEAAAAGLQSNKLAAQQRRAERMARSSGGLFLIRILAALAILTISITSYVAVKMHNPPMWLIKWGLVELPTRSETGYKIEMVALILIALISFLAFLPQGAAGQFMAFVLGVTFMGIVTGNLLAVDEPHQFITYFMTQDNYFITTWICLGLALLCALSSAWSRTTPRQLAALVVTGMAITGVTVAIVASTAPSLGGASPGL